MGPTHPLSDLLAAGAVSGLATRLRKLTGMRVITTSDVQRLQALRQCTALTHLDISGSYLQDCPAGDLAAALQAMPRLTRLHACDCALQSEHSVAAIASALQPLTQLQHLHLARSRLGEAGLAALAPALSAMPGLQTLDVGNNGVSVKGTRHLCTLLSAAPGLTHLDVNYSPLRGEGASLLAAVVRGMTRLQTLNMSYNRTGDIGMVTFAPALAALPHLHTINLSANELGTGAVSMLQPVLARDGGPLRQLRQLNLSSNLLQPSSGHALAAALSTATQLLELNLSHTAMGDEGWVALAPALSRLGPSLQSLEMGHDVLHNTGFAALASALQALTGLTCLKLMHCFTPAAMEMISPALMGMQQLQVLDLYGSKMSAKGAAAFAAALPALAASLKRLTLSYCRIDAEAAANALAPALAQATGLVELGLAINALEPQGAQWLGCMAVAHALKDRDGALADLSGNGVTSGSTVGNELCSMPGISVRL